MKLLSKDVQILFSTQETVEMEIKVCKCSEEKFKTSYLIYTRELQV